MRTSRGVSVLLRQTDGLHARELGPVLIRFDTGDASLQTYMSAEEARELGSLLLDAALQVDATPSEELLR